MNNKFFKYFLSIYDGQSLLLRKKAKALLITNLICISGTIFYIISVLVSSGFDKQIPALSIGVTAMSTSLYLLRKNKYELASNITIVLALLSISAPAFLMKAESIYQLYNISYTALFIFFIALLLSVKNYQFLIVLSISLIEGVFFCAYKIFPLQTDNVGLRTNILVAAFLLLILAYFLSRYLNVIFIEVIKQAEKQARESDAKFEKLDNLISISNEGELIGANLIESTEKTFNIINDNKVTLVAMNDHIDELEKKMESSALANNKILYATRSFKEDITKQNDFVNKTSNSVEYMTTLLSNIVESISEKKLSVDNLVLSVESGEKDMRYSMKAMESINSNADEILDILKVVTSISSNINLLSLNAAIEAAHAGDYGKGFTVVSDEIKILAENTSINIKNIKEIIEKNNMDIKMAVEVNKKTTDNYSNIKSGISEISSMIEEIIIGMNELSGCVGEILNLKNILLKTADNSSRSIDIIEKMNQENNTGINIVTEFIKIILNLNNEILAGFENILIESGKINEIGRENIKNRELLSEKISMVKV